MNPIYEDADFPLGYKLLLGSCFILGVTTLAILLAHLT